MSNTKFDFIRYSNCWEDTDNLLKALDIKGKTGLSILSAGDNTLAMLLKDPKEIVAFDLNPTQIYLYELKRAGFKYLEYEDLISLLGVYDTSRSYDLFLSLDGKMDRKSFEYFKSKPEFFEKGIVNVGKFENYFRIFRKYIIPIFSTKKKMAHLASFKDIGEQREYYERVINNRRLKLIFSAFFGFRVMGKLGRDKAFYNYVDDKEESGQNIKKVFDRGISNVPSFDNPYINYVMTNSFKDYCLPVYLRRENFETIRSRLDRIRVLNTDLLHIDGKFDFFNLSDIFEYMSEEDFDSNISKITDISEPKARIAYYNMQNSRYIKSSRFTYLKELSEELTLATKSYFYKDFVVYELNNR